MHEVDRRVGLQQAAPGALAQACGSPETSSTRSRSRTPLICTTARLLSGETSPGSGSACELDDGGAGAGDRHVDRHLAPDRDALASAAARRRGGW